MSFPTWVDLRKLGNNKAVRSASVWAIVVPIAAKLLGGVEDVVNITVLSHPFTFHLRLPFSWKLLFMAALAFMLANLIYEWFCPRLIKETSNYRDFSDQKRSGREFHQLLEKLFQPPNDETQRWLNWLNYRNSALISKNTSYGGYAPGNDDSVFPEIYSVTVHAVSQVHPYARVMTTAFYIIGFILLALLMGQNIYFVITHW